MPSKPTHYDLLGLPKDAILEEIRHAYFEAARKYHPDVNRDPNAAEHFMQVQKAYDVLVDASTREAYDKKLAEENRDSVVTDILYSRSKLSFMEESQLLYVLLQFSAAKHMSALPTPALNICLVLDRSTSMQGVRMDTVKTAAIELVRQMKPEDMLSIIAFSDRAEVLLQAGRRLERSQIETQIHMIHPSGGTEMYQGLEAGYQEVRRYSNHILINHIILITDGRTYGDEANCLRLADKAAQEGIRITGLGIGTEWNDAFLDDLTARTGGSSHYISKANDLRSFLKDKFNSLSQIFAERVKLELNLEPDVKLNSAFRLQPEPGLLPVESPIPLGSIIKDSKLMILLELVVPAIPTEKLRCQLATSKLSLVLPSDPKQAYSAPISLSRLTTQEVSTELPPREIFQALSQITLYRMQERARQEITEGKIQDASLRLQRLATQLLSLGEVELAQTASIEAERIQQTHMLSAEGEKQIKYGTRSFLLPAKVVE